jgi:hypothetical protein
MFFNLSSKYEQYEIVLKLFNSVFTHKCRKIAFLGKQAVNLIKIKQTLRKAMRFQYRNFQETWTLKIKSGRTLSVFLRQMLAKHHSSEA